MNDHLQIDGTGLPIVIAAGGTGGHIFPATALAQQLLDRGHRLIMLTDERGRKFPGLTGDPDRIVQIVLPVRRIGRKPKAFAIGVIGFCHSYFKAHRLLRRLKPAAVIGFGGYPSLPPLLAASHRGLRTLVHEQNAVLGRSNRFLARRMTAIALSFEQTEKLGPKGAKKSTLVGLPVRPAIIAQAGAPYHQPLGDGPFRIFVTGGSQGARIFSDLLPPTFAKLPDRLRRRLSIVQQCRPEDLERVRMSYEKLGIAAELSSFFQNVDELHAGSHLVIARAGGSTLAEITTIGRPAIYIPLPAATNDHQRANAETVRVTGGGWMFDQNELSPEILAGHLEYLMAEPCALTTAAQVSAAMGHADAAARLADLIQKVAVTSRRARANLAAKNANASAEPHLTSPDKPSTFSSPTIGTNFGQGAAT